MGIEWYRDLVICVWGIIAAIVLIFISVLCLLLYRKVKKVLSAVEETNASGKRILASLESSANTIQEMTASVNKELFKPIMQIVAMIQGFRYGADMITRLFKQNKGGSDVE